MLNIKKIEVDISGTGHITNSYLVYTDEGKGILIDPGDEAQKIISEIKELNLEIPYIVITHAHADHIGALEEILDFSKNTKVIVHNLDYDALVGKAENYNEMLGVKRQYLDAFNIVKVEDGTVIKLDEYEFEIIHTPGHTKGCICIYEKETDSLFTGDTIFHNCYGRCDLYGGDLNEMAKSLRNVFSKFSDITIYPGHDDICNIEIAKKKIRILMSFKGITIGD